MFERIIVAFDGSDHAERALEMGCDLAKRFGAAVHLAHTPELPVDAMAVGAGAYYVAPDPERVEQTVKATLARAEEIAEAHGVSFASCETGHGVPADHVIEMVNRLEADLVVAGRRGRGALAALVLGSTSQRIAAEADCAVLTVK